MQIKLAWDNRNSTDDGTRIYKSISVIDSNNLPPVLVTLGPGASSYIDPDVIRDQTYHYRIEIFKGTDKSLSQDIVATAVPYTGPGPQDLLTGDYERGYFGIVDPVDFITNAALIALVGDPGGGNIGDNKWMKFAYKGKILFIAHQPIKYSTTWKSLYDRGLVYGTDNSGNPGITGLAAVNQKTVVSIAGNKFLVRLMTGKPPGVTAVTVNATATANEYAWDVTTDMRGAEWDDLIIGVVSQKPASFKGESLATLDYATLLPTTSLNYCQTLCQEVIGTTGLCTGRGGLCNDPTVYPSHLVGHLETLDAYTTTNSVRVIYSSGGVTYYNQWRPVLEWIP